MRKIIAVFLLGILTACHQGVDGKIKPDNTSIGEEANSRISKTSIKFVPQYIRTNGYPEDAQYPVVRIIRSVDELKAYYEANKEKYDLEHKDKVYSDMTIGFLDACDKYDEAYFQKQLLVMVLLEEGSGSNRHKVNTVQVGTDGKLYIDIDSIIPEAGTCDMAQWHILIEPEKGVDVENEDHVIVCLDGINALNKEVP